MTSAMTGDTRIPDLIDAIRQTRPLDTVTVARLFGAPLLRSSERSNEHLDVWVAMPAEPSPVGRLELRLPVDDARRGQALLILTLRPGAGVAINALRPRFGAPTRIELPRAGAPHGTPTYEVHDLPDGRLGLGFLPAANDAVRELVFDRPAPGPAAAQTR